MKVREAPGDVYHGELWNSRLWSSTGLKHDFPVPHPDAAAEATVDMCPGTGAGSHHHESRPTRPNDFLIISVPLREEDHASNAIMKSATLVVPRLSYCSEKTRDDSSIPAYGRTRGNTIRRGESLRCSSHGTAQYYYQYY